jgi:acyl carrier protein
MKPASADAVLGRLRALFAAELHLEPGDDDDLLESGLLDSLRLVELLLHIEEQFGLRVPLDEVELDDLRTLRRIANLIAVRLDEALNGSATQRAAAARGG